MAERLFGDASAAETLLTQRFCRNVAEIQWLLVALVLFYLFLTGHPARDSLPVLVTISTYFLFCLVASYLSFFGIQRRGMIVLHALVMLVFITMLLYQTGEANGPLASLYVLAIITSALTLGKRMALLGMVTVVGSYLVLLYDLNGGFTLAPDQLSRTGANLLTFVLAGYFAALLADAVQSAREQLNVVPQLEQRVSVTSQRLKDVVERSSDAFVEMNSSGVITEWNQRAVTMFGWSREEAIGRPLHELIIPEKYREAHRRGLQRFLETGTGRLIDRRVELEALRRDGHKFPVELLIHDVQMPDQWYFDAFLHDISERNAQRSQLMRQAHIDPVTQLANRNVFEERLARVVDRLEGDDEVLLIMIDLDDFKHINDNYGHDVGDNVLEQVAHRIRDVVRDRDLVARIGGDEFVVLMEQVNHSKEQLAHIADKLVATVSSPAYRVAHHELTVTASFGLVLRGGEVGDWHALCKLADQSMYRAKHAGKNGFHIDIRESKAA